MKPTNIPESDCCSSELCEPITAATNSTKPTERPHNFGFNSTTLAVFSFVMLLLGLAIEHVLALPFFNGWIKIVWYLIAYLPVAYPVLAQAVKSIKKGAMFTEFFLMSVATIGAFSIGEYAEGVAVMLFYAVGELFLAKAVNRAKTSITALLDVRSKVAHVYRDQAYISIHPELVRIEEKIRVKVGERIPLDGLLLSNKARLNTAALTGESKPSTVLKNKKVFAGAINLESVIEIEVSALFKNSAVSRILELVKNATQKKAKTELLIRKLAKVYTPIVVYLAIAVTILPYFFVSDYQFSDWLYKALILLVISCPCALVISIPLGYFGGLGAASKHGILFKGAMYMDLITKVNTVIMDKTGTVTQGVFAIKDIVLSSPISEKALMRIVISLEKNSTHPIAKALLAYKLDETLYPATEVREFGGKGLSGKINGSIVLAGNIKLLDQFNIKTPRIIDTIVDTCVLIAIDSTYVGYIVIADAIKEDAMDTIKGIKDLGIKELIMLSGDKDSITQKVAKSLGISHAKGGLLPEDKLRKVQEIQKDTSKVVAFIGDGINDAPVLAASNIGIAMGAMGSDVAIETADVIFQTDEPSKFITATRISKSTQKVIWQNIYLAFGVKILVITLGALGLANMWAAVFADVGVALLAILNAVRLQQMTWDS